MSNIGRNIDLAVGVAALGAKGASKLGSRAGLAFLNLGAVLILAFFLTSFGWGGAILLLVPATGILMVRILGVFGRQPVTGRRAFARWPNALAPGLALVSMGAWVASHGIVLPVPVLETAATLAAAPAVIVALVQGYFLGRAMVGEMAGTAGALARAKRGIAIALGYSGVPQLETLIENNETSLTEADGIFTVEPLTSTALKASQHSDFVYRVAECLPEHEVIEASFGFIRFGPLSEAEKDRRGRYAASGGLLGRVGEGQLAAPRFAPTESSPFPGTPPASSGPSLDDLGI